jgi:hypothetical protein
MGSNNHRTGVRGLSPPKNWSIGIIVFWFRRSGTGGWWVSLKNQRVGGTCVILAFNLGKEYGGSVPDHSASIALSPGFGNLYHFRDKPCRKWFFSDDLGIAYFSLHLMFSTHLFPSLQRNWVGQIGVIVCLSRESNPKSFESVVRNLQPWRKVVPDTNAISLFPQGSSPIRDPI